ncbi:MAG: hypothetical protein ACRC2T_03850, partial [Thermoguttaceae bacterium]
SIQIIQPTKNNRRGSTSQSENQAQPETDNTSKPVGHTTQVQLPKVVEVVSFGPKPKRNTSLFPKYVRNET